MAEGTSGSKSNHEDTSLRKGNLPKSQPVREAKCEEGAAKRCAEKQNTSDGGKELTVVPNTKAPLAPPLGCK